MAETTLTVTSAHLFEIDDTVSIWQTGPLQPWVATVQSFLWRRLPRPLNRWAMRVLRAEWLGLFVGYRQTFTITEIASATEVRVV